MNVPFVKGCVNALRTPVGRRAQHGQHAAVDVDDLAVDERGGVGGEVDQGADQVLHLPPAARGGAAAHPAGERLVGDQRRGELGVEVAGADGVDADAGTGQVAAHAAGQHLDRTLGRRVGGDAGPADLRLQRRDVDDLAAPAGLHPAGDLAADQEGAGDVGGQQRVPVLVGEIDERCPLLHAGVVHADVSGPTVSSMSAIPAATAAGSVTSNGSACTTAPVLCRISVGGHGRAPPRCGR